MHNPVVGDNWLKKQARNFVKFCEHWLVKNLFKPIFFLMPPMLLVGLATRQGLQIQINEILGEKIGGYINSSAVLIIIGAYFYVTILRAAYSGIEQYSKPSRKLETKDMLAIITALNLVVGGKNKRFSSHAKKSFTTESLDAASTFMEITKPEQQIALLISGLRTVFEYVDDTNALFRVGLIRVQNNSPTEWVAFEPDSHPPRTQPTQLAAPSSSVSHCIRKKSIVIVEDIKNELSKKGNKSERRYLKCNTQDSEEGSQLCYPIIHSSSGNVEYIITIAGNKKECLIEDYYELYSWIIENFSMRIALEHSLLILRGKADAKQAA